MRLAIKPALAALLTMAACSSTPQQVSGVVSQTGYPSPITGVRVVQGADTITERPVDASGAFTVSVPPGSHYRFLLLSGTTPTAKLVFPRQTGTLGLAFNVHHASGPIDVGGIHYLGDPSTVVFAFGCTGGDPAGATCVDDNGNDQSGDNNDEQSGDNNQCGADEQNGDNNQVDDGQNDMNTETAVGDHNIEADVGCGADDNSGDGVDSGGGAEE